MNFLKTFIIIEGKETSLDACFLNKLLEAQINECDQYFKFKYCKEGFNIESILKLLKEGLNEDEIEKEIKNILIIVDADEDADKRFKEIQETLKSRGNKGENFNLPKKLGEINREDENKINMGVFLLPDNKTAGSIETLLLKALKHPQTINKNKCIEDYFKCLKSKEIDKISEMTANNKSKAQFRIFRATPHPDDTYVDVAKYINFNSQEFNFLISFIKEAIDSQKT